MDEPLAVDIDSLTLQFAGYRCLDVPSLTVEQGETVLLFGENGSGKTTLMKVLSGLIRFNSGRLRVLGHELTTMSDRQVSQFRADYIGHVFQGLNLIPYLSALENIVLPCGLSGIRADNAASSGLTPEYEAYQLMAKLKFEDPERLQKDIDQLGRGLQQRIAIARALMGKPRLVLADEPASAMGSYSRKLVYELLTTWARENGSTLICISHDKSADAFFDRRVNMKEINENAEFNPLW